MALLSKCYGYVFLSGLPWWLSGKNLPSKQEMQLQSLGWEDPLEKEMATHSSILAWRIPGTEEPGVLQPTGLQRVRHNLVIKQQLSHPYMKIFLMHYN